MEQKSINFKRLGFISLIFLAFVIVSDFVDVYELVKGIIQYADNSSYALDPYQNVTILENRFIDVFLLIIKGILPVVKSIILGIVVFRVIRTGITFSTGNKKNLQWYGILVVAHAFFTLISGTFVFSGILNFLINNFAAIIWFCWPDANEENPEKNMQSRKTAGILHILFNSLQIMIIVYATWYYYISITTPDAGWFPISIIIYFVLGVIGNGISIYFYNRIGQMFRSVSIGVSKFDTANVKMIKKAATIMAIGVGLTNIVSIFTTVTYILELLQMGAPVAWFSLIIGRFTPLAIPLVLLFLALAYEHGASAKLVKSTDIQ